MRGASAALALQSGHSPTAVLGAAPLSAGRGWSWLQALLWGVGCNCRREEMKIKTDNVIVTLPTRD